MKKLAEGVKF